MNTIALALNSIINLTDEQFFQLCQANPDVRLERNDKGEVLVMPPTGWETGKRNTKITTRLNLWAEADGSGVAFDSSTGFKLPNGAARSPDAAWVNQERIDAINPDPDNFLPLAPDFVVELMSSSDSLEVVQVKMQEYQDNGVRLGFLINPQAQQVEIYRQGQEKQILQSPSTLLGENVLPGFVLSLQGIF